MSDQGDESIIPKHGGYRNLKSFKIARLIYDVTVLFCDRYIDKRSRTHDQMVQAARSGVQNIAEGSEVSGTSRKMELKLTQVARASLEELRLDYEDFLRQRGLPAFEPDHPALVRFKQRRCSTLEDVRRWAAEECERERKEMQSFEPGSGHGRTRKDTDSCEPHDMSVPAGVCPCHHNKRQKPIPPSAFAANGALSLLNLANYLLDKQVGSLAEKFLQNGGFTERLYRQRQDYRRRKK